MFIFQPQKIAAATFAAKTKTIICFVFCKYFLIRLLLKYKSKNCFFPNADFITQNNKIAHVSRDS